MIRIIIRSHREARSISSNMSSSARISHRASEMRRARRAISDRHAHTSVLADSNISVNAASVAVANSSMRIAVASDVANNS